MRTHAIARRRVTAENLVFFLARAGRELRAGPVRA
jgi:hypothetical protein